MTRLYGKVRLTCAGIAAAVLFCAMSIFYQANGADEPNRIPITEHAPPRASQKMNATKFQVLADDDQMDGAACNRGSQCDSSCCEHVSATINVRAPADLKKTD